MKNVDFLLSFSIIAVIAAVLFFSRQILFYKYEPEYYENLYYHSQWSYPNSARGISDGELYKFVGYRLTEGENPFNINYEVPPFGKHLYGLAEKYIGNPYWVSILLYVLSVGVLFLLSKELFGDRRLSLLAVLLFVTSPFVATQVRETMLDLPLMFMFLVHVWFFIRFMLTEKLPYLVSSGLFLGFATGTKIGVYTLPAIVLGLGVLLFTMKGFTFKKALNLVLYPGFVFFGYVLSFFPTYFVRHPNPIPWLRLHEKPLGFYLDSASNVDHLNQLKGIFLNTYQGWWQAAGSPLGDWSPVLPLGVVAAAAVLIWSLKKQKGEWVYVSGLSLVFLVVHTFIPFWPRYLMPAIPLFVLLISFLGKKAKFAILILALLNLPFFANSVIPKGPEGDAEALARFISTRAYRELYRSISSQQRKDIVEQEFIAFYESFLSQLNTKFIEVEVGDISKSDKGFDFKYKIKYITEFGELSNEPTVHFIRMNNQWKLVWDWDYVWPGLTPESKIVIVEKEDEDTKADENKKAVYVIPRLMFKWEKHLDELAGVIGESGLDVGRKLDRSVPDQYPRFVGYLDPSLGGQGTDKALSIAGVSLRDVYNADVYLESSKGEKTLLPFNRILSD